MTCLTCLEVGVNPLTPALSRAVRRQLTTDENRVGSSATGLDPKNLHHLSQVFRSRPSPRQRGFKKCALARRSLDGLRRSLARGLDPKNLRHLSQVFRSRPSPRQRGFKKCALARRSLDGLRRSLARLDSP